MRRWTLTCRIHFYTEHEKWPYFERTKKLEHLCRAIWLYDVWNTLLYTGNHREWKYSMRALHPILSTNEGHFIPELKLHFTLHKLFIFFKQNFPKKNYLRKCRNIDLKWNYPREIYQHVTWLQTQQKCRFFNDTIWIWFRIGFKCNVAKSAEHIRCVNSRTKYTIPAENPESRSYSRPLPNKRQKKLTPNHDFF